MATLPLHGLDGEQQDPAVCRAPDRSAADPRLVVSSWPGYLDPPRRRGSTLRSFEQATGIRVEHRDDVNDNASFVAEVRGRLGACEPIGRDVVVLSDWVAARMVSVGWVQPLDAARTAGRTARVLPALRDPAWDDALAHHVPWQAGLTGIAYDASRTAEVRSTRELLERPDLRGRVSLLAEVRDTMGLVLASGGADPAAFSADDWDDAVARVRRAVAGGQVRAFTGNEYTQDLAVGNVDACVAWSGDVVQLQAENPDILFVVPDEGASLWSDVMLVPNGAQHQDNAEAWMDHYLRPEVAARLAAWVGYICPVEGAREAMADVDPALVDHPLLFPAPETLERTWALMPLDDRQQQAVERDWAGVVGG